LSSGDTSSDPGKQILSGSIMIFLSKYQDNQPAEPVKTKTSPFRSLDRTCNLIEEVFSREKSSEIKTYIWKPVVEEWGVAKH
jgi:hypothetical protein